MGEPSSASTSHDHRLLAGIAVVLALVLAVVGVALRDREAVAFAVLTLLGVGLLRWRRGLIGRILLGLVFADTAAWLVPAAVANTADHDRLGSILLPVVISAIAVVGLLTIVVAMRDRGGARPLVTPSIAVLVWAALTLGSVGVAAGVGVGEAPSLPPGAVTLSARNTKFSTGHLRVRIASASAATPTGTTEPSASRPSDASAPGRVTVELVNHDLFWHTFTIDGAGVDLKVPSGGRRYVTFTAKPGTYTFYCAIPGHRTAGMEGTLVVEPAA